MNLYKISDKLVFKTLKDIKFGYLEIKNYHGEVFKFGKKLTLSLYSISKSPESNIETS